MQVHGFFKGMAAPLLTTGLMHSLLFVGYGATLKYLHPGTQISGDAVDFPIKEVRTSAARP